ncbi:hypothetical protein CPB85DRAFT_1503740 [Mucidula mucida]|nr:hypothetical protein CPB85DRAFT_1503740 [Mucidula mucida]
MRGFSYTCTDTKFESFKQRSGPRQSYTRKISSGGDLDSISARTCLNIVSARKPEFLWHARRFLHHAHALNHYCRYSPQVRHENAVVRSLVVDVDKNAGQETFYCASGAKYSLNLSRSACRQGFTEGVVFNSSRTKVEFREGIIGKHIKTRFRPRHDGSSPSAPSSSWNIKLRCWPRRPGFNVGRNLSANFPSHRKCFSCGGVDVCADWRIQADSHRLHRHVQFKEIHFVAMEIVLWIYDSYRVFARPRSVQDINALCVRRHQARRLRHLRHRTPQVTNEQCLGTTMFCASQALTGLAGPPFFSKKSPTVAPLLALNSDLDLAWFGFLNALGRLGGKVLRHQGIVFETVLGGARPAGFP